MIRNIRRTVQVVLLLLFLFLLVNTRYNGEDVISLPVDFFFEIDPLAMLIPFITAGTVLKGLFYSLALLFMTIFLGKFFCGWICPMGTTLDVFTRFLDKVHKKRARYSFIFMKNWQYMILFFLLVTTLLGLQLIWFFDPITILYRTVSYSLYPAFNHQTVSIFDWFFDTPLSNYTEPAYEFIQPALSFTQPFYRMSLLFLFIFSLILILEYYQRRAWCRYICPLGAFWGLFAIFPWLRQDVSDQCTQCLKCQKVCKMGAIDDDIHISKTDCSVCFSCEAVCPPQAIAYSFSYQHDQVTPPDLGKRGLITAAAVAVITPPFWLIGGREKAPYQKLIRPPGALPEEEFLGRCIRCGECMRVCLGNALHPTFLQARLHGMFSPLLVPLIGYCEYNCYLCTQICPTQAIQPISLPQKRELKIGLAHFDRNRCLPWAHQKNCLVCEEHCPTPKKAIYFEDIKIIENGKERMLKRPKVDENLCIGCGICENKCILLKEPAIIVTNRGESRSKKDDQETTGY